MALTVGELQVILEAQTKNFQAGFKAAQDQVEEFSRSSQRSLTTFQAGVAGAVAGLAAFGARLIADNIGRVATGLFDLAEASQRVRAELLESTGSTEDANTVFGALREVANQTNQSLEGTAALFGKLTDATVDLGLSQKDVVGLTETLNNTLKLSGKTGEEAQKAINSFSTSIAQGKVDIGAFTTSLKTVPNLASAIADGLGITQRELLKLAKDGNLTSEQVVQALQRIGPAVEAQAATIGPTFTQALTGIQNEILVVVDAFTNGAGISQFFGKSIQDLSKNLAENLVSGIRTVIRFLANFLDVGANIVQMLEDIGLNFDTLVLHFKAVKISGDIFVQGLKVGFATLRVAVQSLIVAFNAVRLSLGLISTEAFDASAQHLVEANNELIASAEGANKALGEDLQNAVNLVAQSLNRKPDNRVSEAIKEFANDARTAADDAVDAVNKIRGARAKLSTERGPAAAPEQTADEKAAEKAFFDRLKRQQEIEFQLDADFRKERNKRILAEEAATKKRIAEFSDQVGTDISDAFQRGLDNGSQGFLAGFADSLAQAGREGLAKGFADAVSDLTDGLTTMLKDLSPAIAGIFGGGKNGEPTLGGQLLGSAFQLGGAVIPSLISAALKKNDATSAAGNIQSAVNSAQQVRGIVAGPTSIAIADVARGINDAFQEPTRLLGLIERNTRATANAVGATPDDTSTALLSDQSESLI